jgi:hypothetical protein
MKWMVRKMAGKKIGKVKGCKMNTIVAGIDLGDRRERESLTTVLSRSETSRTDSCSP